VTAAGRCASCGAALGGPYCAACGQKTMLGRVTLRRVLRQAAGEVT
jgi:hypothetical protein